jgi:hypothetical protein
MHDQSRTTRLLYLALLGVAATGCASDPDSGGTAGAGAGGAAQGGSASGGSPGGAGLGGVSALGGNVATAGTSANGGSPQGGGGSGGTGGSGGGGNGGTSTGGAAGNTATGGGGASACSFQLCDGFESYSGEQLGAWKRTATGGTVQVDTTHAFAGTKAAQFVSQPGGNKRTQLEIAGTPLFPLTGNKMWGRVMAYAHDLPGMSDKENKNVHYDLIQSSGDDTTTEYRVAGMGGVLLNYNPHDCYYGTQKIIPEDRWACWEWQFDGATNTIEFYIDGDLQAKVVSKGQGCVDGTSSVWQAPTFSQLRIGFVNYQSKAETTSLWLDELAAGKERIGCPQATAATH